MRSTGLLRHWNADTLGISVSGLCLVHCLLTPIVLSVFPALISVVPGDADVHRALACGVVLCGLLSFIPGYRLHRRRQLLLWITGGMLLVLTVAWLGTRLSESSELALSIPGSMMLVRAHFLNRTFCRSCHDCAEDPESACNATKISMP